MKNNKRKLDSNLLLYSNKRNFGQMIFFMGEITIILVSSLISYHFEYSTWSINSQLILLTEVSLFLGLLIYLFFVFPHYSQPQSFANELFIVSIYQISIFIILAANSIFINSSNKTHYNWIAIWFVLSYLFSLIFCFMTRSFNYLIKKNNKQKEKVIIIGINFPIIEINRLLKNDLKCGVEFIGYVKTPCDTKTATEVKNYFNCLGSYENIHSIFTNKEIDQVWICLPYRENELTSNILKKLENYELQIKWIPDITELSFLSAPKGSIRNIPIINVRQVKGIRDQRLLFIKKLQDKLISMLALFMIWPVMLFIAFGVKISSPGPIFYKQDRQGLDGKIFKVIKFRSMHFNQNKEIYPHQAKRNDPRITRFGSFLRRHSLDELPQIFNVLAGSMSIVGPRPHAIEHNNFYRSFINGYTKRHQVKPGITGWAQVNGYRGEIDNLWDMKKRLQYDLEYISHYSLYFDIKIIFLTMVRFLRQETAY